MRAQIQFSGEVAFVRHSGWWQSPLKGGESHRQIGHKYISLALCDETNRLTSSLDAYSVIWVRSRISLTRTNEQTRPKGTLPALAAAWMRHAQIECLQEQKGENKNRYN
jgi:hypothetical protein